MNDPRLIKKYSNRRLYDTETSRYVNLDDVAVLIRDGAQVKVEDAKSGEDLTRQVLTQIIVEDAKNPDGGAPVEFLREMVRATDRAHRDFFQWYLATASEAYQKLRSDWSERATWPPSRKQWEAWSQWWDPGKALRSFLARDQGRGPSSPSSTHEQRTAANERDELDELRQRLAAIEERISEGE